MENVKHKPKWYVQYEFLDEFGDTPYMDWEEETFEELQHLAQWVVNQRSRHFKILGINKVVDLTEQEYNEYTVKLGEEILKKQEKERREKELQTREEDERKRLLDMEQYKLYLELKEKFEKE
jgi:hypothetical protein